MINQDIYETPIKKIDNSKSLELTNKSFDFSSCSSLNDDLSYVFSLNSNVKTFYDKLEFYNRKYLANELESEYEKSFVTFKNEEALKFYHKNSENFSIKFINTCKNPKFSDFNSTSKIYENIKKFDSLNSDYKLFNKVKLSTDGKNKFSHHLCFFNEEKNEKYYLPLYKDDEIGMKYFYKYLLKENCMDFDDLSKKKYLNRAEIKCFLDLENGMDVVNNEKYYNNVKFFD